MVALSPASLPQIVCPSLGCVDTTTPDPAVPCSTHDLAYCAICHPPARKYRRGLRAIEVPDGSYVQVRGGKGVYHHPDCFNVTGDWDGAELAHLGDLIIRSKHEIRERQLRPAQCCQPPDVTLT